VTSRRGGGFRPSAGAGRKKAAEDRRTPRRWRDHGRATAGRELLECASPRALSGGARLPSFRGRRAEKSGGGPPHSTTLARPRAGHGRARAFGVRQSSGAFRRHDGFRPSAGAGRKKAAADRRTPRRWRDLGRATAGRELLECASPRALSGGAMASVLPRAPGGKKRRRTAALHDAGATLGGPQQGASFWSAPALGRFPAARRLPSFRGRRRKKAAVVPSRPWRPSRENLMADRLETGPAHVTGRRSPPARRPSGRRGTC
jgi:hypothetical protein